MKKYLCCNVGELFLRIFLTFVLIRLAFFSTNVFWMGELLARFLMLLLSTCYLKKRRTDGRKKKKAVDKELTID